MDFFTAYFVPQAWVNDYAVDVDPKGPQRWNCTAFVNAPEYAGVRDKFKHRDPGEGVLDEDDVLMLDDAAPKWIQDWTGPFSIYVTRHETEAEMLLELAQAGDRDAAVKLQHDHADASHGPNCSYRCKGECDCVKSEIYKVLEEFGLETP